MTRIDPNQRCLCGAKAIPDRTYLRRQQCKRCDKFIVRSAREVARLEREAKERAVRDSKRMFVGDVPEITKEEAARIIRKDLEERPGLSNSKLRFRLSCHGRFDSDTTFNELVAQARKDLGVPGRWVHGGAA